MQGALSVNVRAVVALFAVMTVTEVSAAARVLSAKELRQQVVVRLESASFDGTTVVARFLTSTKSREIQADVVDYPNEGFAMMRAISCDGRARSGMRVADYLGTGRGSTKAAPLWLRPDRWIPTDVEFLLADVPPAMLECLAVDVNLYFPGPTQKTPVAELTLTIRRASDGGILESKLVDRTADAGN